MSRDMATATRGELLQQHSALQSGLGVADLGCRAVIEMRGKDRAQLLHGLCTNDIKSLKPDEGCEAFLTNGQGRIVAYVYVFNAAESIILNSTEGTASSIVQSLDRYVIREDVRFQDHSPNHHTILLSGRGATAFLSKHWDLSLLSRPLQHAMYSWKSMDLHVCRVPYTGSDSYFVSIPTNAAETLIHEIIAVGGILCDPSAIESKRIESGTPIFTRDITDENLPQEVDRNAEAISFKKGCYLGQETVARLDALGHVNRLLRGVRFSGDTVPVPGTEITVEHKIVCRITSSCWSLGLNAPLALAYVRRGYHSVGSRFPTPGGSAEVVSLPI
jgi:tRNA-modifying protein YgfZ